MNMLKMLFCSNFKAKQYIDIFPRKIYRLYQVCYSKGCISPCVCISGWLVDVTGEYQYMYFVCGVIVIVASIWLFIGNTINYRLLAKEKKLEDEKQKAQKNADSKEAEPLTNNESDDAARIADKALEDPSERETNI